MTDEKLIEAEVFKIESTHHFHGETCLCGFSSARSRSRTEHITGLVRAVFEKAHVPTDVAEEPEWEYGWAGTDDEGDDWVMDDTFDTRESAEAYTRRPIGRWVRTDHGELVRRRKAGPWVPVKQEGESDER